jgi:putative transposase
MCEETGIQLVKVSPENTSVTCSGCGLIHKESRKGERFECVGCGKEMDVDYNASKNIRDRGVYSFSN